MERVYLGLGANLGDRVGNIARALALLEERGRIELVSSLYETEPVGFRDQPRFLNAVAAYLTELEPLELLACNKEIEKRLGRTSSFPNAPRPIDIDILFYGDRVLKTPDLEIPHPRLRERAFVLVPLAELAPDLVHPGTGERVADLLARVGRKGVKPWKETLELRGHHLLCLLGYHGQGYSPQHQEEMWVVKHRLHYFPETWVQGKAAPDGVCQVCPWLREEGCFLQERPREGSVVSLDRRVLARLGLDGARPWQEVLGRVRERVRAADLPDICSPCPWLKTGLCQEALERLRDV